MSERGWLTIAIVSSLGIVTLLFALAMPRFRHIVWIIGLSLALFEFVGNVLGSSIHAISHRHLTARELVFLSPNLSAAWAVFKFLRYKIKDDEALRPW